MTTQRKVLVVGSGGREHALAVRLLESPSVREVLVAPGNAGTRTAPRRLHPKVLRGASGSPIDVARAERPDLVVVGPEVPLAEGLVDALTREGHLTFGPTASAARLEASKSFMKEFAVRHSIRTARHIVLQNEEGLEQALASFSAAPVVKADGLCAGKGVVVARTHDEARSAALEMLSGRSFGDAGRTIVLEERVNGVEASVHAISDGERWIMLPDAQDHKRIGDGDSGPNTGGMGTYAPASLVPPAQRRWIEEHVVAKAIRGMAGDGHPFRGTLFAGLMLPSDGDPVLIEFNVRFGDPETQVILNCVDGDLGDTLADAAAGSLSRTGLTPSARHALCVVLASAGYPGTPRTGNPISGLERAEDLDGVRVYHAGTRWSDSGVGTSGGRVLGVTGIAGSLVEAHARAYQAVECIQFDGMQFRRDIGAQALRGGRA